MQISSTKSICLIGNVYNIENDVSILKSIFINDGKIIKILDGQADLKLIGNSFVIQLAEDEIILPAFINLHTHIGYNVLPIWEVPYTWNNRHQWRNHPKYKTDIKDFVDFIKSGWVTQGNLINMFLSEYIDESKFNILALESNSPYLDVYKKVAITEIQRIHAILSEIQAVCGGTGLLLQTLNLDDEEPNMKHFLIRNTGNPEDMGIEKSLRVFPVVDFYKPDIIPSGDPQENTGSWKPQQEPSLDKFINSVKKDNGQFYSTISHIGEGKTGNLYHSKKDKYSSRECKTLIEYLVKKTDSEKLKKSNLVLVHANGIDYEDKKTLEFLRDHNISIVWSPVSNLLLYNDTLPLKKLLDNNINVCLGTDWTPSGSKHILDEMRFVKFYCTKFHPQVTNSDILKMGSLNPAKALGDLNYSKITEGAFADMFVYKLTTGKNVSEEIFTNEDDKIKFSMINGRIIYGDTEVFEEIGVDYQKFPDSEGQYSKTKGISINSSLRFDLISAISKMDALIETYSKTVLKSELFRTKFLSADDQIYQERITKLKKNL